MLPQIFAFLLGFSLSATLGGLISNWSLMDKIVLVLMGVVGIGLAFTHPDFMNLGPVGLCITLVTHSFFAQTIWLLAGASLAILSIMSGEGALDGIVRPLQTSLGLTPKKPSIGPLGARDELFVKLCLYAFQDGRRAVLTDLESYLRVGQGPRQQALHAIVAPGMRRHGRTDPAFLIRQYQTHFDPQLRTAPMIYSMLCRMGSISGSRQASSKTRLQKIANLLQLEGVQSKKAFG